MKKKVLILAYFFPPCNLPASQRAYGWAKFLHKFGYYPVIVTRNWDVPITCQRDVTKSSGTEPIIQKFDEYEVHYIPYKAGIRDCLVVSGNFYMFRKMLTVIELLLQNFFIIFNPYKHLYKYSTTLFRYKSFDFIIITGNPFALFAFGKRLSKLFKAPFFADYRDDWNTDEIKSKPKGVEKFIQFIESFSERRWIRHSIGITSVSEHYTKKIAEFVNKKGYTIYNGFIPEDIIDDSFELDKNFSIVYNGSLYKSQNICMFLDGFKLFINSNPQIKAKLLFPGLKYDPIQAERVSIQMKGYEHAIEILDRIPRKQVIEMQKKSHALLMISHTNAKGVLSSKLFEYIGIKKPIILCPGDKDEIDAIMRTLDYTYICNSAEEVAKSLEDLYKESNSNLLKFNDTNSRNSYSREIQTKKLAQIFDSLL